jgi:N utilization substance protein A
MSNINLIESFQEFKDFKNIDRPTMMSVLEDVFRSMIRKKYGTDENCDVIVNTDNGDLEIWRTRVVMEDVSLKMMIWKLSLLKPKLDPDLEVGDEYVS